MIEHKQWPHKAILAGLKDDKQIGKWAILYVAPHSTKVVQTYQGIRRWKLKQDAINAIHWHAKYVTWRSQDPETPCCADALIEKAVKQLLKDGTLQVVKVTDRVSRD